MHSFDAGWDKPYGMGGEFFPPGVSEFPGNIL